jgi:hypothetical protein
MRRHAQQDDARLANRARLDALAAQAMAEVPGTRIAADQPFRLFDVAVDFAEDAGPLPLADAERIAQVFRAGGAAAKVSSIHVNAWIGEWDKLRRPRHLFATLWQPLDEVLDQVAYLGDSPNDAPLFAAVPLSVGSRMSRPSCPACRAAGLRHAGRGGAGFVRVRRGRAGRPKR